jgi:aryl carrier-like protein
MSDHRSARADVLLAVLRENLGVEDFAMDSDFYASGGDSLVAVRVVNAARERGLPISLQDLMAHQTVRGMLSVLDAPGALARDSSLGLAGGPDLGDVFCLLDEKDRSRVPAGVVDAIPASALATGMLYLCEASEDSRLYRIMEGWEVRSAFNEACFRAALAELSDRHPALRSSFDIGQLSVPVQLVWKYLEPVVTVLHATDPGNAADLLGEWRDKQLDSRVDWSSGPLARYCVVVLPDSFHVVSSVHHALIDGWSLSKLTVDLMSIYRSKVEDSKSQLPALSALGVQRAFIAAERAAEASGAAAEYWMNQASAPGLLTSGSRATRVADASAHCEFDLDSSLVASLGGVARLLNASMKSVFLAAHVRALSTWSGRDHDVVTGVVFNTRPAIADSDRVAGLFLNTMPIRFATVGGTWAGLVRAAAEMERECVPFLAYPQARLVELLRRPAFDVIFNFVNFHAYRELDQPSSAPAQGVWHFSKPSFPFHVTVQASSESGQVRIGFDPSFISLNSVETFADTLRGTLLALAENPVSPTAGVRGVSN